MHPKQRQFPRLQDDSLKSRAFLGKSLLFSRVLEPHREYQYRSLVIATCEYTNTLQARPNTLPVDAKAKGPKGKDFSAGFIGNCFWEIAPDGNTANKRLENSIQLAQHNYSLKAM